MSDLQAFLRLGFDHVTDPGALDHVLFLLALTAIYQGREWRAALPVVSAFTAGHSVTLALAVSGMLLLPTPVVEFLIPLTIVATGVENLLVRDSARAPVGGRCRPIFAGIFGLVHGAGFANYLRELFVGSIALPLLGFNLGIELGQIAVLALTALVLAGVDRVVGQRRRLVVVSAAVALIGAGMALDRAPW